MVAISGLVNSQDGGLSVWNKWRWKTGWGWISLVPTWNYYAFCGTGRGLRFGVHYSNAPGTQVGKTLEFSHSERGSLKSFVTNAGSKQMPPGNFALLGRHQGTTGCSGASIHTHAAQDRVGVVTFNADLQF